MLQMQHAVLANGTHQYTVTKDGVAVAVCTGRTRKLAYRAALDASWKVV